MGRVGGREPNGHAASFAQQEEVQNAGLSHDADGAQRQRHGLIGGGARLAGRCRRRGRPQQRRPENGRQIVQRHFVLHLVVVNPATSFIKVPEKE